MSSTITLERLWKAARFTPNDNQREAIQHTSGPLYLPAGPGSGKTRVLLWRTLNLIVFHAVPPDAIYLSTFTEKAARQLRDGLRSLLGMVTNTTGQPYDISRMYVGTVHSLCGQILTDRRFAASRSRRRPPVLMDELGEYLYLNRRCKDLFAKAGLEKHANKTINGFFGAGASQSRHLAVTNCLQVFNRFSEECIDTARHKPRSEPLRTLLNVYAVYLAGLAEDDRTGFSLLQQRALEVIGQSAPHSGNVFQHVIIDEYQDTNTVQERLFFALAQGHKNICVVGDDDQALYRFRGATVENFVEFPERCRANLDLDPRRIPIDTNYRSRDRIVSFYNDFVSRWDWDKKPKQRGNAKLHRVEKTIQPFRVDGLPAVVASTPVHPDLASEEIAALVKRLIDQQKVQDPNQIAFLYPSLKSAQVARMIAALEGKGLNVYAPRAGRFLETLEATSMLGLYTAIFGRPEKGTWGGRDYEAFHAWLDDIQETAKRLVKSDAGLAQFVKDRQQDIAVATRDYEALKKVVDSRGWDTSKDYDTTTMSSALLAAAGLSQRARSSLSSRYLSRLAARRSYRLSYIINRATSVDWSVLDLFYRLCGFQHFQKMFDLAETGRDEGPVCNLSLLSRYLARFVDQYVAVITGRFLAGDGLSRTLFQGYLYALYRRGESEFEDAEDPFPRGRIPFLTIHQAKGLEFPVVVLGNPRKKVQLQQVEEMVHPLLGRSGEPLDRMAGFDCMRMFYVALSRAKNLLVVAHFKGRGQSVNAPFSSMLDDEFPRIPDLSKDLSEIPNADGVEDALPKTYSYTGDYLQYQRCPRQYMIFRKFDFAPARSQTMFFGSLVHQTIEDLHQHLIALKEPSA